MNTAINSFIQVTLCSGLLYANYHLLLRNKRFHLYNRYYLLTAVVVSILVPFVNVPIDFSPSGKHSSILQSMKAISSVAHTSALDIPTATTPAGLLPNVLPFFYLAIGSVILVRFIMGILTIRKLLRKYKVERTADIYFINTAEPGTPFSFFKWLFWNNKIDLQSPNGQQMFRHEFFHIQQRHSWDIIFLETVTVIFWINPFFHFIKKELKTIHEFLADEFATKEKDKWNYAELLLIQVLGCPNNRLVNPFFHNQIKRRIAMITSSRIPKYQFFRKLMMLPITILVFVLFSFRISQYSQTNTAGHNRAIGVDGKASDWKMLPSTTLASLLDTTKPKSKQKTKANAQKKEIDQKKIENGNEAAEFKQLMAEKQQEIQQAQEEFKLLMMEKQKETEKAQEEFRKMMEARQREAERNGQGKFKELMQERQMDVEKAQEEFKKMMALKQQDAEKAQEDFKKLMEARQGEAEQKGQETFKRLMEERQKEVAKYEEEFKKMMMMKQKETEKSQEEFNKLLENRQQEMQKMLEEFKKKMLEKNGKQVI